MQHRLAQRPWLPQDIAARYARIDAVDAVVLAGSTQSGLADKSSDVDLYVYSRTDLEIKDRAAIALSNAQRTEIDNRFWEPGDEWIDATTGTRIDVMFRSTAWIEEQLNRLLLRHEASIGYSTCFWFNVTNSRALFDRNGWYERLQQFAHQPYPEALRRAIIAKNHPILRRHVSSYLKQLALAVRRTDWVSLNHRTAALLSRVHQLLPCLHKASLVEQRSTRTTKG